VVVAEVVELAGFRVVGRDFRGDASFVNDVYLSRTSIVIGIDSCRIAARRDGWRSTGVGEISTPEPLVAGAVDVLMPTQPTLVSP